MQGTLDMLVRKVIALQPMHVYYSLTRAGRKILEQESAQWERLSGAITSIVRAV